MKRSLAIIHVIALIAMGNRCYSANAYDYNDYYNEYNDTVSSATINDQYIKKNVDDTQGDVKKSTSSRSAVKVDDKKSKREWRFPVGIFAGTSGIGVKAGFEYKYIGLYGTASTFGKWTVNVASLTASIVGNNSGFNIVANARAGLKIQDYGIDLRIKPFNGAFHVDVGYHYIDYSLFINASSNVNIDSLVGSRLSIADLPVSASVSMRIAKGWRPYFGLGWDIRLFYQFHLTIDVGVLYVGQYQAPVIAVDYSGIKEQVGQVVAEKANDIINDAKDRAREYGYTGENSVLYSDLRKKITDLGISLSEVDSYARKALDIIEGQNIPNLVTGEQVMSIANVSTDAVYGLIDDFVADKNEELKQKWSENKIVNYAKVWPIVKLGFVYKF